MKNKEKKTKLQLICDIICYSISCILAIVVMFNLVIIIKGQINENELPSLFGYSAMAVETNSMEPTFSGGDLILIKKVDATELKKNDVISFYEYKTDGSFVVVTHRIIGVVTSEDGIISYQTQGDANDTIDNNLVSKESVAGLFIGKISGIGSVLMYLSTPKGMILFLVLPLVALYGCNEIYRIVQKKRKNEENNTKQ